MNESHEIIKQVQEKFRGLPDKMARLFGKTSVWWRSHGYELQKNNPLANGNLSPVDHYCELVEQYEAAAPGAGKMLNSRVYAELGFRLDNDCGDKITTQNRLRRELLKEAVEAVSALDEKCLTLTSKNDLQRIDGELAELAELANDARAVVRAHRRLREGGQASGAVN